MFLTRNNVEGALAGKNITVNDLTVTGKLNATVPVEKIDVKKATLENLTVTNQLDATQTTLEKLTVTEELDATDVGMENLMVDPKDIEDQGQKKHNYLLQAYGFSNKVKIGSAASQLEAERNVDLVVHGNETISGNLTVHNHEIIELIDGRIDQKGGGGGGGGGDIENINCKTLKVGENETDPTNPTYIMTAEEDQVTLGYTDADDPEKSRKVDLTVNGDLLVTKIGSVLEGTKEQQQDITIGEGEVTDKAQPENNYYPNNVNMYGNSIWIQANEHNIIVSDFVNVGETTSNSDEVDITEEEETKTITLQKTEAVTENIRLDTQKMRINCLPQNILLVEPDNETTEVMDSNGKDVPFERLDPDNKTDYFHKEKSTTLPEYISDQVEKKADYINALVSKKVRLMRTFGVDNPDDEKGLIIGHQEQSKHEKTLTKPSNPDKVVIVENIEGKSESIDFECKSVRCYADPEKFFFSTHSECEDNLVWDNNARKLIGYDEAVAGKQYDGTVTYNTSLPEYIQETVDGYNKFGTKITGKGITVGSTNYIKEEKEKIVYGDTTLQTKVVNVIHKKHETPTTDIYADMIKLHINDNNLKICRNVAGDNKTVYNEYGLKIAYNQIDEGETYYEQKEDEYTLGEYVNRVRKCGNGEKYGNAFVGYHRYDKRLDTHHYNGATYISGSAIYLNHHRLDLGNAGNITCKTAVHSPSVRQHICNSAPSDIVIKTNGDTNEDGEEGEEEGETEIEGEGNVTWTEIPLMEYLDPRTCTKMGTNLSPDQDIVIGTEKVTTITNEEGNEETIYDAMGNVDIHGKTVNIDGNIVDIGDAQNGKTYIKGKLIDLGDHTSIFVKKDGATMSLAEYASQAAGGGGGTVSCDTASNFGTTTESTYVSVGNTSSGLRLTGKEIIVQNKGLSPMDLNAYIQSVVGEEIETASASKFGTTTTENIVTVGNADSILSLNGTVLQVKEGSGVTRTLDTYISDVVKTSTLTADSANFGTNTTEQSVAVGNTNSTLSLMGKQIMIAKSGETAKEMISYIDDVIDSKVVPIEEQNNFGTRLANGQHIIIGTVLNKTTVDEETGEENTVSTAAGNIILNGKQIVLGSDEYAPMVTYNQISIDDAGKQTIVFGAFDSLHDYLDHQVAFHTRYNNMFGDQTNMAKVQLGGTEVPATNIVGKTIYIGENGNSLVSLEKYIKQKASNMTNVTVSDADNANETTITPGWVVTDNATVTEELAVGNITVTGQVSTENITTETSDGVINVNRPLLIQNEGEGDSYSTTINGGSINAYEMRLAHELNGTDATFTGGVTANTITCNELITDADELPVRKKMRFSDPLQNAVMDRAAATVAIQQEFGYLHKEVSTGSNGKILTNFNIVYNRLNEFYVFVSAPAKMSLAGDYFISMWNSKPASTLTYEVNVLNDVFPADFNKDNLLPFEIPFNIKAIFDNGSYLYPAKLTVDPGNNTLELNMDSSINLLEHWAEDNHIVSIIAIPGTTTIISPTTATQTAYSSYF